MPTKIIHIPHSSKYFPKEMLGIITDTTEFDETILKLTDTFTDELFDMEDAKQIVFPYSRCYCDVERYFEDSKEVMAKKGMGVRYTKGINGKDFKNTDNADYLKHTEDLYFAHHNKLKKEISKFNQSGTKPLVIDAHSFSDERFKNDGLFWIDDIEKPFPDICLGYNPNDEASLIFLNKAKKLFQEKGYIVSVNEPYAGSISYDDLDHTSVMIEINKRLYLKKDYMNKSLDFNQVKNDVVMVLKKL